MKWYYFLSLEMILSKKINKLIIGTDNEFIFYESFMMKFIVLSIMLPLSACGMQQKTDWLIAPSNISASDYRVFYNRLFGESLNKKLIKRMKDYERVRRFKEDSGEKAWIDNELEFQHNLRYFGYPAAPMFESEKIRAASFILSGVKKNADRHDKMLWLEEPLLHVAVSKENKLVIAALLLQNTDTTLTNYDGKTPLQMVKRMALKEERFSDLEECLKRYIWHKHVLLHKRFSQKWGEPFNTLPPEIVTVIAEKAYGPYK